MGLFGSLFSGVSGLTAQSNAIAVISDNVANSSTVGYKANSTAFETLITEAGSSTNYASGGVQANTRRLIDRQGLLQSTGVVTDIAVSGEGMIVVADKDGADGDTGNILFTRSGSFRKDERGNFTNAAGYFLKAWPLDGEGRLPGDPGNLNTSAKELVDSLETVNLRTFGNGSASATTKIELALNLDAKQEVLQGAGQTMQAIATSAENANIGLSEVIVPNGNVAAGNDLVITTPTSSYTFTYGGVAQSVDASVTNIMGASNSTQIFSGATVGDNFTISTTSVGTATFTYQPTSPVTANGQFNNLETLAEAISSVNGLTARVVGNTLYMAPTDGQEAMIFADVAGNFIGGGAPPNGGLNGAAALANTAAVVNRFSSLEGLRNLVEASPGISTTLANPLSGTRLTIYNDDPLSTITFTKTTPALPATNDLLTEFGLTSTVTGPAYDPTAVTADNLAGGNIVAHFRANTQIFDALGTRHEFRAAFVKLGNQHWSAEVFAVDPTEIISTRTDGLVASGNVYFNGDGTLRSVDPSLKDNIEIQWANEALPSNVSFDWGTEGQVVGTIGAASIGQTDGLRQLDAPFDITFIEQNGVQASLLSNIEIDQEGFIIANYANGLSRKLFKIPLADFPNPNGLTPISGNAYAAARAAGDFNLREPGSGGAGTINSSALEQPNVELADELTKMLVAQRNYQANTKTIKVSDELLQELNRLFG